MIFWSILIRIIIHNERNLKYFYEIYEYLSKF